MSEIQRAVIMGVSGTGKSTVGELLARELGWSFVEGDDHHPKANIEKMAAGTPLDDDDRRPWLEKLGRLLDDAPGPMLLTCSALRRSYRDLLRWSAEGDAVYFVHLHAPYDVLLERMSTRNRHFMPASLLQSQFETLEPLEEDELGAMVDVTPPVERVLAEALGHLRKL